VLGQLAGTVTVADRSEARLRSVPEQSPAVDVETTPGIALTLDGRRTNYGLGYGVRIGLIDLTRDAQLVMLHMARANFGWAMSRRLRLTLSQDASLGREVVSALTEPAPPPTGAEPPPPEVTFVPRQQIVYMGALRSAAGLTYLIDPRWTTALGAYYEIGGGADTESQRIVPRRHTEGGDLTVTHTLTPADQLLTVVAGSRTKVTTTDSEFHTVSLLETWQHMWSSRTSTRLGAGAAYLRSRDVPPDTALEEDPPLETNDSVFAAARAEYATTRSAGGGANLTLTAITGLDTGYNPLLGEVLYQASGSLGATWSRRRLSFDALFVASTTLGQDDAPTVRGFTSSLVGNYVLAEGVEFQAGVRTAGQLLPDETAPDAPIQWVAFAALSLSAPIARF
jgi:hypothetical protein